MSLYSLLQERALLSLAKEKCPSAFFCKRLLLYSQLQKSKTPPLSFAQEFCCTVTFSCKRDLYSLLQNRKTPQLSLARQFCSTLFCNRKNPFYLLLLKKWTPLERQKLFCKREERKTLVQKSPAREELFPFDKVMDPSREASIGALST